MQERVLYFQRETQKSKIQLGHDAAPPTRQCATALCSRCASDTMPRCRRANAPQPAAAATPVAALVALLHVCLCPVAATARGREYSFEEYYFWQKEYSFEDYSFEKSSFR